jgi:hypothetical protein
MKRNNPKQIYQTPQPVANIHQQAGRITNQAASTGGAYGVSNN